MKIAIVLFSLAVLVFADEKSGKSCESPKANIAVEWKDMNTTCINAMMNQIQKEIDASMSYLSLGAYFSQDKINRPGFAKFFFDSASEEREHAIKLISYLLVRGELTKNISGLINLSLENTKEAPNLENKSGKNALQYALQLETEVTKSIRNVIEICEGDAKMQTINDYELVDYLTGEFLKEQYEGQRELAGKISTLDKMMEQHEVLGEFLFDKTLL